MEAATTGAAALGAAAAPTPAAGAPAPAPAPSNSQPPPADRRRQRQPHRPLSLFLLAIAATAAALATGSLPLAAAAAAAPPAPPPPSPRRPPPPASFPPASQADPFSHMLSSLGAYSRLLVNHQQRRLKSAVASPRPLPPAARDGASQPFQNNLGHPAEFRRRRVPLDKTIPLPLGFGYINSTYFFEPATQPAACGDEGSNDPSCGRPHAYDFIRYAATMEELVVPKGYPLEAHEVTTSDGYNLALYRIPHGRHRNTQRGPKPVIFLMHGVTLASNCFTVLNPNESMAFVMADAGFDVWMGNTRGNVYSYSHQTLSPYSTQFWRFSIDELALIDLPLMIDTALEKSGATATAFVGHSQGCTLAYLLLAAKPEYNEKVSVVNHMGPVMFIEFTSAPFLRFAGAIQADQLAVQGNIPEFLPTRLTAPAALTLCGVYPHDEICAAMVSFLFFGPSQYITPDDYLVIWRTWPSGISSRNLEHWAQQYRDSTATNKLRFRQYDYGTLCNRTKWIPGHGLQPAPLKESCNQEQYGALEPPVYNLSRVTAPNAYYFAEYDVLTMAQDVTEQYRQLPAASVAAQFFYAGYGHMDFVWDRNAKHLGDMIETSLKYAPGTF